MIAFFNGLRMGVSKNTSMRGVQAYQKSDLSDRVRRLEERISHLESRGVKPKYGVFLPADMFLWCPMTLMFGYWLFVKERKSSPTDE